MVHEKERDAIEKFVNEKYPDLEKLVTEYYNLLMHHNIVFPKKLNLIEKIFNKFKLSKC